MDEVVKQEILLKALEESTTRFVDDWVFVAETSDDFCVCIEENLYDKKIVTVIKNGEVQREYDLPM